MPRSVRKQSNSKTYHIMIRGNERKNLFYDDDERIRFIDTLYRLTGHAESDEAGTHSTCPSSLYKKEKEFDIYAYCLMDNHVHLLINEGEDNVSRIMKRIGCSEVYT